MDHRNPSLKPVCYPLTNPLGKLVTILWALFLVKPKKLDSPCICLVPSRFSNMHDKRYYFRSNIVEGYRYRGGHPAELKATG